MSAKSGENLRTIRFTEELLPESAQLLDVAARLCPVSEDARRWFSRFIAASGVEDARTVNEFCSQLRTSLQAHKNSVASDLQQNRQDSQPSLIFAAWTYALDTMILEAQTRKTCYWIIEGTNDSTISDSDSGDITLRRV